MKKVRICRGGHGPFPPGTQDCPECRRMLPTDLYDEAKADQELAKLRTGLAPPPPASSIMLDMPWGPERIDKSVGLGRDDVFSPFWEQIRAHDPGSFVGREHASLRVTDGQLSIRDNRSKNHTYVDKRDIGSEPVALDHGAEVGLGPYFSFTVRLP